MLPPKMDWNYSIIMNDDDEGCCCYRHAQNIRISKNAATLVEEPGPFILENVKWRFLQ